MKQCMEINKNTALYIQPTKENLLEKVKHYYYYYYYYYYYHHHHTCNGNSEML